MSKSFKRGILGISMVLPSFLVLVLIVVIPIISSLRESLKNDNGGYDLSNYTYLFTDKLMRSNIIFTLEITIVSSILVLLISYSLAVYMRFNNGFAVRWIRRTYMIPIFIPSVIATYGLIQLLGNHGWMARILYHLGTDSFPRIIFDMKGIILANLWFNIPFTTMLLGSALSGVPDAVIESAKDVGAGRMRIFFRLILPLTFKTLLVALTFVFMGVIGSFTAPFLIGPNAPQMLGVSMEQIFSVFQDRQLAAATAFFTFLLCSFVGYFYIRSMIKEESVRSS
ncbi:MULTISPECIES: ABC transporter permease [Paenibacillus]|uniref:ABC transporter permease n=1 Tax=Paenibacillus rhizosphaerae TaxID=297318 RepID=A0A1R1EZ45_9BACL|nr:MULTISPECIES: ABC transporter permease subunit [Paenibacillus]MBJ9992910.1 ABC transporter permease subunit [Paenibacillus sp. S28]OMF57094.1 ABC transporter permease [Paenibacillus rhizosphaerae]OXL84226.1 ABC transporter permease [Paenibacillus sp. SSG-1]UYO02221.1 ABC transporter permease subunit [Paenibacillus sp. PSB04]GIO59507.1 spermidine/putrescine ABC transporter permease [Paenibacillus cineris]